MNNGVNTIYTATTDSAKAAIINNIINQSINDNALSINKLCVCLVTI